MDKKINILSANTIDGDTSPAELVGVLLKNRHITKVDEFMNPPYPLLDIQTTDALEVITNAIKKQQNILVYGDYDVDGITATAILWQAIYKIYPYVTPFVPHREKDGYGIKASSFFRFQQEKGLTFGLIITVDNGIVAKSELQKIKLAQDIKIIVTDHHLPNKDEKITPDIALTVHSSLISGSAVSWLLSCKIDKDADLGLAALGTVADCLPLTGINRSIVVHGLQSLRLNPSPGLKKLISISGAKQDTLSTYDLGFLLGPRINAVGRLSDPTDALRLMCSQNQLQASRYAKSLDSYNQDRQLIQKESLLEAEKLVSNKLISEKLLFISGEYNPGIIGLIAGRLTEKYYLPSVVISTEGSVAKGSCRSIPELNIIEALRKHSDLFIDLGGHSGAAGFSILPKNIVKLHKLLAKTISTHLKDIHLQPHIDIDAQITIQAVNKNNIRAISQLSPFGIGNPEPIFIIKNVKIANIRTIGQNSNHLKFKINNIDAIAFQKGELSKTFSEGQLVDIVASLSMNTWNNLTTPQLIVKEIVSNG